MELEEIAASSPKLYDTLIDFIKREKTYIAASTLFTIAKVSDAISTYVCSQRFGIDELFDIKEVFMNNFGIGPGLVIEYALLLTLGLTMGYIGNKVVGKNIGNLVLIASALPAAHAAYLNFNTCLK